MTNEKKKSIPPLAAAGAAFFADRLSPSALQDTIAQFAIFATTYAPYTDKTPQHILKELRALHKFTLMFQPFITATPLFGMGDDSRPTNGPLPKTAVYYEGKFIAGFIPKEEEGRHLAVLAKEEEIGEPECKIRLPFAAVNGLIPISKNLLAHYLDGKISIEGRIDDLLKALTLFSPSDDLAETIYNKNYSKEERERADSLLKKLMDAAEEDEEVEEKAELGKQLSRLSETLCGDLHAEFAANNSFLLLLQKFAEKRARTIREAAIEFSALALIENLAEHIEGMEPGAELPHPNSDQPLYAPLPKTAIYRGNELLAVIETSPNKMLKILPEGEAITAEIVVKLPLPYPYPIEDSYDHLLAACIDGEAKIEGSSEKIYNAFIEGSSDNGRQPTLFS